MKESDSFNRTLDFNTKFKYFIAAWALTEVVLVDATYKFIVILNNKGAIHLPKGLVPSNILWGDGIILNLVKLFIICIFGLIFGIAYTYLSRKVLQKDKASISIANSVMAVFGTYAITLLIIWIISSLKNYDVQIHESLVVTVIAIRNNTTYTVFLLLQIVGAGLSSFTGLAIGQKIVKNIGNESKGKLLGISWFHYLWLWPAVTIYAQSLLWLVYSTLHAIMYFLHHFKLWEILGISTRDQTSGGSFTALIYGIGILYFIAIVIIYLMIFQREILSGKRKVNIVIKVGASLIIAFVIPALLIIYTVVGSSSVR